MIGIGLIWGFLWAMIIALLVRIVEVYDPDQIDPGEEPVRMAAIIGWVGLVSGGIFGLLMAFAESGKAVRSLSLGRAAVWGALGSAVFPLLTQRADQVFWTCPLGSVVALGLVALARNAERRDGTKPRRLRDFFSGFVLASVRHTVDPSKEGAK